MAAEGTPAGGLMALLGQGFGPVGTGISLLASALFAVSMLQGMKDRKRALQQEEDMRLAQEQATMGPGGMMGGMGGEMGGMEGQIDPMMLQQALMSQGQGQPY